VIPPSTRRFLERIYAAADELNRRNILELVGSVGHGNLCDLGCDDGDWTSVVAARSGCQRVYGIEVVPGRADEARARNIDVSVSDLDQRFPFDDGTMDIVHANQVIEHVTDVDHFMSETRRILRVGGIAVISTENGSSWHNIFAAVMGWQIFSATNISKRTEGLGNPLAIHRGGTPRATWTHKTIFNFRGLRELAEIHGLRVVKVLGAGYYPLPATVGRFDTRHAHFLTLRAEKVTEAQHGSTVA
jgi:SAM-dependent methyltransferase